MKKILLVLLIALLSVAAACFFERTKPIIVKEHDDSESFDLQEQPITEYGIPIDSFEVYSDVIRRNQTLGSIFEAIGASGEHIRQLGTRSFAFDIKKVRAGNPYKVYYSMDSLRVPRYMVYDHSTTDYVVFQFSDTLGVWVDSKNVATVTKLSEAEISSSLWEAMQSHNLNPVLALDLSEVFAWAVDFFALFKGDRFVALYDEQYVDSTSVGIGTIHASRFEHRGETFYAFRFQQDSIWSFWDEQGNSLRKAFLKSPLRFSRITSRFSYSRMHPILRIYRPHTGVDYAAPEGTPVMALGDGVVIEKGYTASAGNYVKIKHNSVYTTGYNHFSRFGKGIAKGTRVTQGQIIGYVGKTGYATGPHLDLRFWKNGKPVDPLRIEAPSVEPIKDENRQAFLAEVAKYKCRLDSVAPKPVLPELSVDMLCQ